MRRRSARLALTTATVVALAGCGGADGSSGAGTGTPPEASAPTAAAAPSTVAPAPSTASAPSAAGAVTVPPSLQFSARTLDGEQFDGARLVGRPAVLWFWAPWCPTCRGQASGVASTAAKHPDVGVVGVAGLDQEPAMKRFVASQNLGGLPHLSDRTGAVWKRFAVTAQSTFVLLDSSGRVAFKGYLDGDELADRVGRLS